MKKVLNLKVLGVLVLAGAGLVLAGCKSTPELTQAEALSLIQAKYDQTPAAPYAIVVNDQGMGEGVVAKYWAGTKRYPNGYWADFTLTPEGKKIVKLSGGGDSIQWRPDKPQDPHYAITMMTVVANHLKAHDVSDIQDEILPGSSTAKGASFVEGVNLDGVPDPMQGIAHNPGNKLSTKRHADFVYDGTAWKLQSIE